MAHIDSPVGIAATHGSLVVTSVCHGILRVSPNGRQKSFTAIPGDTCSEQYVAVSPAHSGFPPGVIFVTERSTVLAIQPDGSRATTFVVIPKLPRDHIGITFDQVGRFGHDMIVTGPDGQIWRVTSSARTTLITNLHHQIEGPVVVPSSSPVHAGEILVASEINGTIESVGPDGQSHIVAHWPGAEHLAAVPDHLCTLKMTKYAAFLANYSGSILGFSKDAFVPGSIVVTSEGSGDARAGLAMLTFTTGGAKIMPFFNDGASEEAIGFNPCVEDPLRDHETVIRPLWILLVLLLLLLWTMAWLRRYRERIR
ncbi:MAG: hypothetical protein NVSMB57_16930 [Actinomycetota bacterium]